MVNERSHMEPKLRRADQLQTEVDSLSRELQVLGELYQQQREERDNLSRQSQREQELGALCVSMTREKEALQKIVAALSQQLQAGVAKSRELEEMASQREKEITSLKQKLVSAQGKYQAKMKVKIDLSLPSISFSLSLKLLSLCLTHTQALQDKYSSMVTIGQQLETQILELRGRPVHHKRKHVIRHQRSSSHPTVPEPHTHSPTNTAARHSKLASNSLTQT